MFQRLEQSGLSSSCFNKRRTDVYELVWFPTKLRMKQIKKWAVITKYIKKIKNTSHRLNYITPKLAFIKSTTDVLDKTRYNL
jgi:hypothetical protein